MLSHYGNRSRVTAPITWRDQTVSFALPLARRLFRTSLPSAVFILARKPWTLLLWRFLGWKVLSMVIILPYDESIFYSLGSGSRGNFRILNIVESLYNGFSAFVKREKRFFSYYYGESCAGDEGSFPGDFCKSPPAALSSLLGLRPKPRRAMRTAPHRLLKKAGENFYARHKKPRSDDLSFLYW